VKDGETAELVDTESNRRTDDGRRSGIDRRCSDEPWDGAERRCGEERRSYVGRRQAAAWRGMAS
jgi:hypothetical protein